MNLTAAEAALAWSLSYLVGAVPVGFLLVKLVKGTDVRQGGSGNIGATNVTRVAGKGLGRVVFALDVAKGAVAVSLLPMLITPASLTARLSCGMVAVVGHCFPVFLGFHGGKGVATAIGVVTLTMPGVGLAMLLVWGVVFFLTRTVSLASLAAAVTLPLTQSLLGYSNEAIGWGGALALLLILRHSQNIRRLLRGEEHHFR